ncbi:serine hydrolase domain-containing protein [Chryseobacterium indologenes]|uniref:Serine hydrolase n=1 Tax=Chryseobacterium indologenes TaxID=253 RepID=A0A0N1KS32_CHRID|nr:serine hydrolase domain-containing protein [Chryseobacterium indologenes]KPE51479.1 serine hydrolase [Chryseobacterium indologenes]
MKLSFLTTLFLLFPFLGYSQKAELSKSIDHYIKDVMKNSDIPGLAVGIIKNNQVIYQKYYGTETLESPKKVNPSSIFRVYSTTKLMANVGVFQLIEQGKIALEDPISKYFDNLPEAWKEVKIKHLLTHSSGIPDIIYFNDISVDASNMESLARLFNERMDFKTGNEYRYNQTNYLLLTMIIEKVTGQHFEDFIINNQFPESRKEVVFSSNSLENIPNRIVKYDYNAQWDRYEKSKHVSGVRSHSGNGLAITLPSFLKWSIEFNKNKFLKEQTKEMMWQPFIYENSTYPFSYGWEINKMNGISSYGFSGGNVSVYKICPDRDLSIIIMYNGYKGFPVQYHMANHIAQIVDNRLKDSYSLAEESIISEFMKKGNPDAEKKYRSIKTKNPTWDFENTINTIGYVLLGLSRADEAVKVFEMNVKEHPKSGMVFDSLGEGYLAVKNYKLALANYTKSLELDPQNNNAENKIKEIRQAMEAADKK